tara:strand:- start:1234 stop:2028 length:795 start_codon:yes stop_codon:yes gene_type:complete
MPDVPESPVEIYSYLSGEKLSFVNAYVYKATIGTTSEFAQEAPFGRSSKIYTFGGTTRDAIALTFYETINSVNFKNVIHKITRMTKLQQAMYPGYGNTSNSLTLKQAPLLRVFVNPLISNGFLDPSEDDPGLDAVNGLPHGLLCYCSSFSIDLDRTAGAFKTPDPGTIDFEGFTQAGMLGGDFLEERIVFPSKISYSMTLLPIEDFNPGFQEDGETYDWTDGNRQWPGGITNYQKPEETTDTADSNINNATGGADVAGDVLGGS